MDYTNDHDMAKDGLAALIEIVSSGLWKQTDPVTKDQSELYLNGVRDGRIADVTFQAATLATIISR